jgi:host factor-I protein
MQERAQNIQDVFLNKLRKGKTPVTIFLSNGVKLQGNIGGFDNFSVLLKRGPQMQLVYKHTIATVVPAVPVNMFDDDAAPQASAAIAAEE